MPEGPEVKIVAEQLDSLIRNATLTQIEIIGGRFLKEGVGGYASFAFPAKIEKVGCKGKAIFWHFNNNHSLYCSLAMTGGWKLTRSKHSALAFHFEDQTLYFEDIRHFGIVSLLSINEVIEKENSLGPDMLSHPPSKEEFYQLLQKHSQQYIVRFLLDQSIVSGIGNYIKSEALYLAGISPYARCKDISIAQSERLYEAIRKIMHESYQRGGNTLKSFTDVYGRAGSYQSFLNVYGRTLTPLGELVRTCKTPDQRRTWYVDIKENV